MWLHDPGDGANHRGGAEVEGGERGLRGVLGGRACQRRLQLAYVAGWFGGDPGHEVRSDVTVFRSVRLRFDLHGVGDEGAATLIEAFKSR